ncbi:hypothetical protein [Deinococcus budaensis]|uniref:Uncharacterized protein n=1 Tax=Deinococcus budaensis TaxID=1665626 RepID=A0A7W8GF89_9DEIO|nr:hypothetical protein [Deinococcus budaensis]MBB5234475.1 hypothetical protein [Deinococcus budaensis]
MTDTLALLQQQNSREVWLLLDAATQDVTVVRPGTPGAGRFVITRVPARDIRSNLLYAALGRDGYLAYANWYNSQAQQARAAAEGNTRKADDPEPFDDSLPDDARWRAHTVALEEAVEDAVLAVGLTSPEYGAARSVLGAYRSVLVREIVQWGREPPAWDPPVPPPEEATPEQLAAAEENDLQGNF